MYPNDVIVMKMTSKFRIANLHVSSALKALNLLELALPLEGKYCFSCSISSLQTICRKYLVYSHDFLVAMVTIL